MLTYSRARRFVEAVAVMLVLCSFERIHGGGSGACRARENAFIAFGIEARACVRVLRASRSITALAIIHDDHSRLDDSVADIIFQASIA